MRTIVSLAAAALSLAMFMPNASAQHSATWKARGLPRSIDPAANYVGRTYAGGGMLNYDYPRPYNVARGSYRYGRMPYYAPRAASQEFLVAAPQSSDRRSLSYQPDQAPTGKGPAQGPWQDPGKQAPQQAPYQQARYQKAAPQQQGPQQAPYQQAPYKGGAGGPEVAPPPPQDDRPPPPAGEDEAREAAPPPPAEEAAPPAPEPTE